MKYIKYIIKRTVWRLKWLETLANSNNIPKDYEERLKLLNEIDTRIILLLANNKKIKEISIKNWKINFPGYKKYKWESIVLSWNVLTINKLKWIYNNYPKSDFDNLWIFSNS